jgi:hypothetical protein
MYGIGLAMQAGAVLLAVGAVAVLRWLPSHDLVAQPREAPSRPSRSADCLTEASKDDNKRRPRKTSYASLRK